jgi:two-component system sensor histidine kinase BaeS
VTVRRGRVVGSLGARLALAFVAVALGALLLFAGLVLFEGSRDVRGLTREQRDATATAVASAAASAYAEHHTWTNADLDTAVALAAEGGGTVAIFDSSSRFLAGAHASSSSHSEARPITVNGTRVGTIRVGFPAADDPTAVRHLRDALLSTVAAAAGLAALLAVVVAVVVARRLTRPLNALTTAAQAVEDGDLAVRVGDRGTRGELRELTETFDRMADALEREDGLRRALVADVAHEVRTPLTTLRANLESLVDGVTEPTHVQLASLHDDVLRLSRVIGDLEALAAAESAAVRMEVSDVDLGALAEDTTEALADQFDAAGIDIKVQAEPVTVRADVHRLRQVLANLLTNALKFTPEGGSVVVRVEQQTPNALLSVADTGLGIPIDEQAHIFDRFWRGEAARHVSGSGIGLTIAAEIVHAHGGAITVDSTPNAGTRVTVSLPVA